MGLCVRKTASIYSAFVYNAKPVWRIKRNHNKLAQELHTTRVPRDVCPVSDVTFVDGCGWHST